MTAFDFRSTISPEMIAATVSWAIYGAVKEWFCTPDRAPAEQIVHAVLDLVMPIFVSAGPLNFAACSS
jgi:hypothetical protein